MKWFLTLAAATSSLAVTATAARADVHRMLSDDDTPTLVADTPALQLELTDAYKALEAKHGKFWDCSWGEVTNIVASWQCEGVISDGGPSYKAWEAETVAIVNGHTVPLPLKAQWKPNSAAALAKLETDSPDGNGEQCKGIFARDPAYIADREFSGITLPAEYGHCSYPWNAILPLLLPKSPLAILATAEVASTNQDDPTPMPGPTAVPAGTTKTAKGRFVADGADLVRDTQTGLDWSAKDNGADLDAPAAAAWVKAYKGGGKTDWRMPTIDELAALAANDLAHRDKTDCTKGKNAVVISPLIHISCGLVWSATTSANGQSAFGYISGTPRVSKPTLKTNYRALAVRKHL